MGHHSTSDDSTKYRPADEIEWWKLARDPVSRFRKWIESNGWWRSEAESSFRSSMREKVKLKYLPKQLQDKVVSYIVFCFIIHFANFRLMVLLEQLLHAIQVAEKVEKPPVADMFTDVYDSTPSNLHEQEKLLKETIRRHPQDYPSDVPA